jgi:glucosamine kinase
MSTKSMRDIFIGVDGGATRCRVRVEDADGNLLGTGASGSASIRLSVENTWREILAALNIALQQGNLSLDDKNLHFHLGLGLAGCEIPEACKNFLAQTPKNFAEISLQTDAYTACLGAHAGKDGAIIIVGTGVVGLQIQKGKSIQIGGWGFPYGDEGSGAWLGLEAVRLALQWKDGRLPRQPSGLFMAVFKRFDDDMSQLIVWANSASSSAYATLAPLVIEHAETGDAAALALLQQGAYEVDRVGKALAEAAGEGAKLPCALLGGIAKFIKPWLGKELKTRVVDPRYDAAIGAILLLNKNRKIK